MKRLLFIILFFIFCLVSFSQSNFVSIENKYTVKLSELLAKDDNAKDTVKIKIPQPFKLNIDTTNTGGKQLKAILFQAYDTLRDITNTYDKQQFKVTETSLIVLRFITGNIPLIKKDTIVKKIFRYKQKNTVIDTLVNAKDTLQIFRMLAIRNNALPEQRDTSVIIKKKVNDTSNDKTFSIAFTMNIQKQSIEITASDYECGDAKSGKITFNHLGPNTLYKLSYYKDGTAITPFSKASDSSGTIILDDLAAGIYSGFTYQLGNSDKVENAKDALTIKPCLAVQNTEFFAAAFANYAGVQDDDPENFQQVYAYISVPLNRSGGIRPDSNKQRDIWLRYTKLQLVYGNTDKFKMYTLDTLNDKYVNKLDLLAHAYFNANLGINILTYILPKNHKTGDLGHAYLDFLSSLVITNVTDTLKSNDDETNIKYNIKSSLFGLRLGAKFTKLFNTRFGFEGGAEVFQIYSLSSTVNNSLNPQGSNIADLSLDWNKDKDFAYTKTPTYFKLDFLISYNTAADEKKESNVFLHYAFTSNYAKRNNRNHPNNYFQFQIGYALELSKIFAPKSDSENK